MVTYEGPHTVVAKVHVSYVWRTLREWVVFITGLDGWVARHTLRNQLCVVMSNAALATGCSSGPDDPNWATLANSGFPPLALNRAIPGACNALASDTGRHAASHARDFKVYVLDRTKVVDGDQQHIRSRRSESAYCENQPDCGAGG